MTLPNTSTDQHAIGNDLDTLRTQRAAEHERIAKVEIAAKGHPGIAAQAIREGWSVDRAELEVLRASRGNAPSVAADAGSEQGTAIEAALCLSAGMRESAVAESIPEAQREQVMNAAVSRGYRGMGIQGAFRAVLAAAGESPGMGFTDATIRAAFEANQVLQASAGGFSTISLPGILSNSATKVMLGSYDAVATTWQQFCHVGSNTNFKAAKRYRMVGMGEFKEVGPDGELKHISLAEQEYDAKVSTKGAIIALTRQMIINDDLGAFMALPAVMGRMSAIAQDKAAYTLLLSNPSSFFASGNNNYIEGASTTLSIDSLAAAEQKFTEAVDDNGEPILVMPKVLIVPPALRTTGREIVLSAYVQRDQESDRQPTANVFTEKFDLAVSPWLGNSKITGNSQTAWYLAAGPGDVACMEMSFLNGRQTPTIESGETSFDTLGMQWRAYNDFGVSMGDHRAAFKSKGAS
ncbi:MAG: Mu-like prophage major head subunit gpT family protein [Planctomycetota bacterium]